MRPRIHIVNRRSGGLWWRIPVALLIWIAVAAPIVAVCVGVYVLRQYAADLPAVPDLDAWEQQVPRTSRIVAADGTVLAEIPFRDGEVVGHRLLVSFGDLPERLVRAILAAEDLRFFDHHGVDPRAVARAAWKNYRAGRVVEGASTLTQQVARGLLPDDIGDERSLRRKVREALLARRIEQHYDKRRIFEVYANHVFLGAGAYGVQAAARAYFSKTVAHLSLPEVALIAGLAQAPGRADPYKNLSAARARRDQVLERMHRAGFIDEVAYGRARASAIELAPPSPRYGLVAPWYTERARREVQASWPAAYARGGLLIETAASPALAMAAERAARENATRLHEARAHKMRLHTVPHVGALVWDHVTGYMEATVGGLSWDDSQFDRSTQACRQPGSAFKPIVFAAAVEADVITPGTPLRDAPIAEYDEDRDVHWKPSAAGHSFRGVALAHDALAASLNAPAVDVFDRVGAERVIDLARRLGIDSELDDVRPLALGSSCIIPLELAGAFATFAQGGQRVSPIFVTRVSRLPTERQATTSSVLVDRTSAYDPFLSPRRRLDRLVFAAGFERERALDAASAFLVTGMLRDVVRRGTATRARSLGRPLAGKTGTTNDNTDAWFVGFSARVVAAVWVGHDDPAHTLAARQDGRRAALPLWIRLVADAEGERPSVPLLEPVPAGVVRARIDRETGYLAQPGAGGAVERYFKRGTEPVERVGHVPGVPVDLSRWSREF